MGKKALVLALLLAAIALSGCVQQEDPFQGGQYLMPQETADLVSEELAKAYDEITTVEMEEEMQACLLIDGAWCSEEERKEWEEACATDDFPEECNKASFIWNKEGREVWRSFIEEKKENKPLAIALKNTRSNYDVTEIGSSFKKLGTEFKAYVAGMKNVVAYEAFVTRGTAFNGIANETEILNYFAETRAEFENNKNVSISDERAIRSFFGSYTNSAPVEEKEKSINGAVANLGNLVEESVMLALPSPQKEEIVRRIKTGYEETLQICESQADRFDAAKVNKDYFQMAYSAGYLGECNQFLAYLLK